MDLLAWGQQYVDSGLASVLNSTSPIFVFVIILLVTRDEAAGPCRLAGACLGGLGVVLIFGVDVLDGLGREVAGQLAVLFGAMLYAVAAIYGKRFAGLSPTVTAAGTMIWATLFLVPASLVLDQPWRLQPSMASWPPRWRSGAAAPPLRFPSISGCSEPWDRWASRARAICGPGSA